MVELRTDPPVDTPLDARNSSESDDTPPYKPSPSPSNIIHSPTDYSPNPSPPASLSLALTPNKKYGEENQHTVGDYYTIISVKTVSQRVLLVWITHLAGQYCYVLTHTGEELKKHGVYLQRIPPFHFLSDHAQYEALEDVLFTYKSKLAIDRAIDRRNRKNGQDLDNPSPARSSPLPSEQVDNTPSDSNLLIYCVELCSSFALRQSEIGLFFITTKEVLLQHFSDLCQTK